MACIVIDIGPRSDSDPANCSGQGVRNIITIQVEGGDHRIFGRAGQDLLQESIRNNILDQYFSCFQCLILCFIGSIHAFIRLDPVILLPRKDLISEFSFCQSISPQFELTFRELHDIPFVNNGYGRTVIFNGIVYSCPDKTFGPFFRYRFNSYGSSLGKADLGNPHFMDQKIQYFIIFRRTIHPFYPGINIF